MHLFRLQSYTLLLMVILNGVVNSIGETSQSKSEKYRMMSTSLGNLIKDFHLVFQMQDVPPDNHVNVTCSLYLNNITSVDIKSQTLSLDVVLTSEWMDRRLTHTNISEQFTVPTKYHKQLWLPDVGFSNSIGGSVHKITDDSLFSIALSPGGALSMTSRLSVDLSCEMNFKFYPMDTQLCELQLESWKYTSSEISLQWAQPPQEPLSFLGELLAGSLPQYEIYINTTRNWLRLMDGDDSRVKNHKCEETYEGRGTYSCLEVVFIFKRDLSFYGYDIYLPLLLIVLISFIGLFIDYNVLPARIGIGSLSVSATTNIGKSFRVHTPPVSYTKAADVWLWSCLIFVYAAFLELGVVNVFNRKFRFDKAKAKDTFFKRSPPAKVVDKIARIFFPSAFTLFNIIYWTYYMTASGYNNDRDFIKQLFNDNYDVSNLTIQG